MPDQLLIHNGQVVLSTEEGQQLTRPESQLLDMLRGEFVPPWTQAALPDGVKFYDWRPPFLVVVHQTPPHVRLLRWIAPDSPVPFGEGVVYRNVRLSLPYMITFAVYQLQPGDGLYLTDTNELYFRNEPLRSRTDTLGYPSLLNISRVETPLREKTWICTQYLEHLATDWPGQLQELLEHTFNGGFNLSSENHEGASWYGVSAGVHPDLHPVERWEQATRANDAFALGVPWKPVPLDVNEVIEAIFLECNQAQARPDLASRFLSFAQQQN